MFSSDVEMPKDRSSIPCLKFCRSESNNLPIDFRCHAKIHLIQFLHRFLNRITFMNRWIDLCLLQRK